MTRAFPCTGCGKFRKAVILSPRAEKSRRGEAKNPFLFRCLRLDRREILRSAQNDKTIDLEFIALLPEREVASDSEIHVASLRRTPNKFHG